MCKEGQNEEQIKSLLDIDCLCDAPTPMTKEQAEIFLRCTMFEQGLKQNLDELPAELEVMEKELLSKDMGYQVIQGRLEWVGISDKVSFPVKLLIRFICDNPGQMSLWAYTFFQALKKYKKITMSELTDMFPLGLPTSKDYSTLWDAQKKKGAPHSNAIDNIAIYK